MKGFFVYLLLSLTEVLRLNGNVDIRKHAILDLLCRLHCRVKQF